MARTRSIASDDILDAAEAVLRSRGIHQFTQDVVTEEAGISKGALVYNYPTKNSLIEAMLEREFERFSKDCEEKAKEFGDHPYAPLLGYLRAIQKEDEETTQKAANLMAAVIHAPDVMPVVQAFYRKNMKKLYNPKEKSGRKAQLAFLAAEGLFFLNFFGIKKFSKKEWESILDDAQNLVD